MSDEDYVPVDYQWRVTDINPVLIANLLGGELEESRDMDSKYSISMYYGHPREQGPVCILKLHPEERKVFLDIPGPLWRGHKIYFAAVKLTDVVDILFAEYTNPDTGLKGRNIVFCGFSRVGERANALIVSSEGFRIGGEVD